MYERMLDKSREPSLEEIKEYVGTTAYSLLCMFEDSLKLRYDLVSELRFPFGNSYGWGYKYSHKSFHLCYAFFENRAFTVMIQIGDKQVPALEKILNTLSPKSRELWDSRYPCGEHGGWVRYRVLECSDLPEILKFVNAKKKSNAVTEA